VSCLLQMERFCLVEQKDGQLSVSRVGESG
jgi:hypothetical protein